MNERSETGRSIAVSAILVFLAALATRLVFLLVDGGSMAPDSANFLQLGRNLAEHWTFSLDSTPPLQPSIVYPPGYPFFLAGLHEVGVQTTFGIGAVQAVVDAMTAVGVFALARGLVSLRWALAGGLYYAVHPGPIPYVCLPMSETLFTFILMLGVALLSRAVAKNQVKLTAAAGVVLGLAALTRSIGLLIPVAMVVPIVVLRVPRRATHAAVLMICSLIVVTPWCIRSSLLAGQFVPVQGRGVLNFYSTARGHQFYNVPAQEGVTAGEPPSANPDYFEKVTTARTPAEIAQADREGLEIALRRVRNNPGAFALSRAEVFPHLFINSFDKWTRIDGSFSQLGAERAFGSLFAKGFLLVAFSLAPFLLAMAGLWLERRNVGAMLSAAVWVYTLVVHLPLWIEYRFWLPALPALAVSATIGLASILGLYEKTRIQRHDIQAE